MPTDGEHRLARNVLFPCVWEDLGYTHAVEYGLGGNFLAQLALAALKEELMVRKGDGKEKKEEKSLQEERKPPPSLTLSFFRVRSSSEGIHCGQDRPVWT